MSENLTITKEAAAIAFNNADKNGKKLLSDLFGEKNLYTKITDRVKSYEDACEVAGVEPIEAIQLSSLKGFVGLTNKDIDALKATAEMYLITRVLNEGWVPDWSNTNQYKYYPWLKYSSAGFGFSSDGYAYVHSTTTVGSRLCFKSKELAEYAGKQFQAQYNRIFNL